MKKKTAGFARITIFSINEKEEEEEEKSKKMKNYAKSCSAKNWPYSSRCQNQRNESLFLDSISFVQIFMHLIVSFEKKKKKKLIILY